MLNEGYQPNKGELDVKNPPKGGSGVPNKEKPYNQIIKILNELNGVELQWTIKKCYALLAED